VAHLDIRLEGFDERRVPDGLCLDDVVIQQGLYLVHRAHDGDAGVAVGGQVQLHTFPLALHLLGRFL